MVPELQTNATSRLGDIWVLGRHKVFCGSALQEDSYHELLRRERVQMVITDPPYNVAIVGHVRVRARFIANSSKLPAKCPRRVSPTSLPFPAKHKNVTEDGAIIYVFMDHAHSLELQAAAYPLFGKQKNLCVWVKDSAGMGSFYRSQHELVYIFKNGIASHINNFNLGRKVDIVLTCGIIRAPTPARSPRSSGTFILRLNPARCSSMRCLTAPIVAASSRLLWRKRHRHYCSGANSPYSACDGTRSTLRGSDRSSLANLHRQPRHSCRHRRNLR